MYQAAAISYNNGISWFPAIVLVKRQETVRISATHSYPSKYLAVESAKQIMREAGLVQVDV